MSGLSKDFVIPSVASTSQVGQENRTLKVTLLSKEWRSSTEGDLSTINRELAIQLAKHSNVEVSVFLPQCSEEDRNNAASHHVQLVEAEKWIGWDPVDWLINVPYGHVMDCVVGHGISLGKQVQVIRKHRQCKWIQVVHTQSTEIAMFKKNFSQSEQLLRAEVKLCEMADQVVAIGPLVAESYMFYLRCRKKEQNVFVLTPSIFSEYLNVEQATEERKTFSVLVIGSGDSCEDSILTGFRLAAQAVAELKDESYKLYFYGAPRGKEGEIAGKLLQEGISPEQIFISSFGGRGKVLADLFCKMDLAVMPSKTEGFGVIALKALSAGLPILVSGNSGFGVALKEVPLGSQFVVDSEVPKDWAQNIKMVRRKTREVRLAESKILREKYQEKYSWKEPIGRLVEKMYSLLFEEVPLEIRARGRLALGAFKKALSEGRTCIKRVPIMLIGQDRSGKTSLAKSLKGERFNPEEDSTVGIQADPSYFKVSTEIWKPGEKDEQQNVVRACTYEHHAARLIVQNLSEEESVLKEESLESDRIEHLVEVEPVKTSVSEDIVSASCVRDENMIDSCSQSEKDISSLSAALVGSNTTIHDPVSNSESDDLPVGSVSISVSQDYTISDQQPAGNIQTVPDDVASLVEVLLGKDDDSEHEEDIYSVLWDFGGQEVYYTTHPLFFTSRAIYLLVNDLSRPLHHKAESVMKQGMFTKSQDSFRLETNADYLDFWMSSIASLTIQDKSNSKKTKSDMLPELPPVFLVCTHADEARDRGDPRELGRTVFGHLQTKPYKNHLHDVFVVDNTKSGQKSECPEVLRLRKEIRAVAEELPHMKEAVPIKWLKFEKEMQAKKDEGNEWIFLEEAKEIAGEVCNVSDDEEFRTLLNFLHDQRVLIHFDDTPELNKMVVLDPQWLINVFKEVITIRPFDSKEKKFKELWSRLEIEGVLEEPLLEHVWGPLYRKEDTCQSLIAIMEKFSLLCSWPSSDGSCGKQYLVPSMLMSHPPEEIMELIASAEIPPLFLKFETGQVPPGLFPRLVLQVLQWCKQECTSPEHPQLHHNFARIYRSEEVNCSVILLCHISSIEVVVHRGNDGHEVAHRSNSAISSPVNINHDNFACAVLRQLELTLESMRREFCWLQNMKYEVSFLCPVCCHGGVVSYCRTHRTKGCKQEECLHFWPESAFCREKKVLGCTRSASAQNNKVLVRDFEPWFSPTRNQLTVDKCDDGNLASVEDGKETFSAGEVLQIRFTQQRDDQTVSPQLKESLQLEGACPVMPNSDSQSGEMLLNSGKTTAITEICLPDNVEQSLLSASCDAKEIVHQLMENLQLNKDVFEKPDYDTKKIIRSLAHRAKDLERLDVFEYLRKIAQAGTTGPFLAENLPVQEIPPTEKRKLTIHLSGGDEWMQVAEGLGLTSEEIRFLDKRTLNPMESALSFIVKQRFLSVGELYELLNKCNFPMLADLL